MTIRAAFRALGWVVSELIPAQAIRVALDRDYSPVVTKAAAVWDAADDLAEYEEQIEVHEGRMECGSVDAAEPLTQSPPDSAGAGTGVGPAGVSDDPSSPSPPAGHSNDPVTVSGPGHSIARAILGASPTAEEVLTDQSYWLTAQVHPSVRDRLYKEVGVETA